MEGHAEHVSKGTTRLLEKRVSIKAGGKAVLDDRQSSPEDFSQYGRTGTQLCTYCVKLLVLGQHWKTSFALNVNGPQVGTISHQMEHRL